MSRPFRPDPVIATPGAVVAVDRRVARPLTRRAFLGGLAGAVGATLLAPVAGSLGPASALTPRTAVANSGWPPPVRTADGRPIIRDWLAEHRRYGDWHRTLIDPLFRLHSTYAPSDLVAVTAAGISGRGVVRRHVLADLRAMDQAARASGVRLRVVSAYRSFEVQRAVFASWVERSGWDQAVRYSARAGHSEHQLGTTLDLSFVGGADPWTYPDFGRTPAGAWLRQHAWRYGFVISYPKGMERSTGYAYEPWHVRYYGRSLAAQWRASGLVPRYWLWRRS